MRIHKPEMFKSEIICLTSLRFFRNLVLAPPNLQTEAVCGSTWDLKVAEKSEDLFTLKLFC